jgi:asparagine synthase (glutamine-hydrolysing)
MQPFHQDNITLICNGEIYNHHKLANEMKVDKCKSDCEIIIYLYNNYGIMETVKKLDGEFAFVLLDHSKKVVYAVRDITGVKPLYYRKTDRYIEFSSLVSAISTPDGVEHIIPRNIYKYDLNTKELKRENYYDFITGDNVITTESYYMEIYKSLNNAVIKRISQSERPVGFFLSGGLDSSAVLAIALQYYQSLSTKVINIHVFTFGFEEKAPDVMSANFIIDYFRKKYGDDCVIWHLLVEPIENGLDALPEVITALETYDTTTIRASTPMYLLSKYIKNNTDITVILSGEGSDELFGGYLYFQYAPDEKSFTSESIKLMSELYLYDNLRADRTTANNSLEIRPPFLDKDLIESVYKSKYLLRNNKYTKMALRVALSTCEYELLPAEILYGKKEAFSDAVGLSWKDEILKYAINYISTLATSDKDIDSLSPYIKPNTDEQIMYELLFMKYVGNCWQLTKKLWLPNQQWVDTGSEPSARVLPIYFEYTS